MDTVIERTKGVLSDPMISKPSLEYFKMVETDLCNRALATVQCLDLELKTFEFLGPVRVPGLLVGLQPKSCHFEAKAKPTALVIRVELKVCSVTLCSALASCDSLGFPLYMFAPFNI